MSFIQRKSERIANMENKIIHFNDHYINNDDDIEINDFSYEELKINKALTKMNINNPSRKSSRKSVNENETLDNNKKYLNSKKLENEEKEKEIEFEKEFKLEFGRNFDKFCGTKKDFEETLSKSSIDDSQKEGKRYITNF
jgi:hypothetical protein